jgi:hypothetical protein
MPGVNSATDRSRAINTNFPSVGPLSRLRAWSA